jgi:nucleotide-binding universal stress UspA family protein
MGVTPPSTDARGMDSAQVPAGTIVVGIDGSPSSDEAFAWAVDQAALEQRPLTIVHTAEPMSVAGGGFMVPAVGIDYAVLMEESRAAARELLSSSTAQALASHPGLVVHEVLTDSDTRSTLLDLGRAAAMIVVGSRGRGPVASLLLGSISVSVSKHASCPVVVHRPTSTDNPRYGVLVGVDGTETSLPAIDFAYRMASWRRLPLTVLHSYLDPSLVAPRQTEPGTPEASSEQALVAESLAGMQEKFPDVQVQVRLSRGFADQHLILASRSYDLLVIGHHPLTALEDIVHRSVAPTVVEHAHGPVVVVP